MDEYMDEKMRGGCLGNIEGFRLWDPYAPGGDGTPHICGHCSRSFVQKKNSSLEDQARTFALEAHGSQRYGTEPYEVHLRAVRDILKASITSEELLTAAWLHDVLEDTSTTYTALEDVFGNRIADWVWRVTKVDGFPTRREENAYCYGKLHDSAPGRTLKLADRIANIEASNSTLLRNEKKLEMYIAEDPLFVQHVMRRDVDDALIARYRLAMGGVHR
jgi:guanosine-3',5'-bis(diphosphate) 3'-pyrophosphohydrolase